MIYLSYKYKKKIYINKKQIYIYIYTWPRKMSTASGHGDEAAGFSGRTGLRSGGWWRKIKIETSSLALEFTYVEKIMVAKWLNRSVLS